MAIGKNELSEGSFLEIGNIRQEENEVVNSDERAEILLKRAGIRNKLSGWKCKIPFLNTLFLFNAKLPSQIGVEEENLTEFGDLIGKEIELNSAEFEETAFRFANTIFQEGLLAFENVDQLFWEKIIYGGPLYIDHKQDFYFDRFIKHQIPNILQYAKQNELFSECEKSQFLSRVIQLLLIKFSELWLKKVNWKSEVINYNTDNIAFVLFSSIARNGLNIGLLSRYFVEKQEKQGSSKVRDKMNLLLKNWLKLMLLKQDLVNFHEIVKDLKKYEFIDEIIDDNLRDQLANTLMDIAYDSFGTKLENPEDIKKLGEMDAQRLTQYFYAINYEQIVAQELKDGREEGFDAVVSIKCDEELLKLSNLLIAIEELGLIEV